MSRILSKELGPRAITVNVVAPGPVATDLFLKGKGDDEIKPIVGRTPLARLGEPLDIARVVSFLAGPDGAWVIHDINVLSTQRVNRAVLPHMRAARRGLLVWISSTSVAGGIPPLLGPYFVAKAGMDQLATCYARELAPFGIETAIVVPGAYTKGTNHFAHAGHPGDEARAGVYEAAWPAGFSDRMQQALAATNPPEADPAEIGRAVAAIVQHTPSHRPFRTATDPTDDGVGVSFPVVDRVRAQFLHRVGFPELLRPAAI